MKLGQKHIEFVYISSVYELNTQDGLVYRIYPIEECDCEPDFTCYVHAGYFTEQH